jgi:hypothetical protein
MSNVLGAKDVNAAITGVPTQAPDGKPDIKSMEYHRRVLQNKMDEGEYVAPESSESKARANRNSRNKTYISPSDNIMSPCTAKLSAFRNKQVGK